jgi:GT2 family glycosyltransferase
MIFKAPFFGRDSPDFSGKHRRKNVVEFSTLRRGPPVNLVNVFGNPAHCIVLKPLGILLITYQCEKYMTPLLESLATTIDPAQCVIWVLDNASTDTTFATIERETKRLGLPLRLSHIEPNIGYARAANRALAEFRVAEPCEVIVMLNPDMVVYPGWWQPLVAALKDPKVGTAASLLLLPDGTVNSRGNAIHFLGVGFVQGYGEPASALPARHTLFCGSGAAMAYRPAALDEVNASLGTSLLFWEELYIYAEDTDLGWRFRLAGFDHVLVPESRVLHDHQFWLNHGEASGERFFQIERNRYLLLLANFKGPTVILLLPWIVASELALGAGLWRLYPHRLKLWRAVWAEASKPDFWTRRRRLQAGRVVGDRAILKAMTGSIRHGALAFRPLDRCLDAILRWSHRLLCFIVWW